MLGMGDLQGGSPDSRNDHNRATKWRWFRGSAALPLAAFLLEIFGYPKIVTRAGACSRARRAMPTAFTVILERPAASPR